MHQMSLFCLKGSPAMRRHLFLPLAALALTAGSLLATSPAGASSITPSVRRPAQVTSNDWAGYAATGATGAFTSVASSWTQPKGHCSSGDQYAAFLVGLDGYSSDSIEEIGTQVDCVGATAEYLAWYDMYPADPVYLNNTVDPGDQLSASVVYTGSNKFTLKISDATQGWSHTTQATLAGAARSSAEILVEAPCCTSGGGILPLTDFGSVSFTGAMVNKAGLCDSDPVQITMPGVTVSPITDCTNFTVTENKTVRPRA
jgi:Peptidase A4 family